MNKLKIASLNASSLANKSVEIFQHIVKNDIDLMYVQETWITPNTRKLYLHGYDWIHTEPSIVRGSGVGIFIKSTIVYKILNKHSLENGIEFITLNLETGQNSDLKVICVYQHPFVSKEPLRKLERFNLSNSIICGDFNAHSSTWSLGKQNKKGLELIEFCLNNKLTILSKRNSPTLQNHKTKRMSSPDLFLVAEKLKDFATNVEIGEDIGSDHLPLTIEIKTRIRRYKKMMKKYWIFAKLDALGYSENLENKLSKWESSIYWSSG